MRTTRDYDEYNMLNVKIQRHRQAISAPIMMNDDHADENHQYNLVQILNKEPKRRSVFELQALYNRLITSRFFSDFKQKYGEKELRELIKRCYHE